MSVVVRGVLGCVRGALEFFRSGPGSGVKSAHLALLRHLDAHAMLGLDALEVHLGSEIIGYSRNA